MTSSYTNNINYLDLLAGITFIKNPRYIVEFGILNGHSLKKFADSTNNECNIDAYDIFDDFNGNHATKNEILEKFIDNKNVNIEYGDFYSKYTYIQDNSIDILHVDIANNGEIYDFCIKNYLSKIKDNGIIIMEGGSVDRDNIEWMNKYNKKSINPYLLYLENNRKDIRLKIIGNLPSITLIEKI